MEESATIMVITKIGVSQLEPARIHLFSECQVMAGAGDPVFRGKAVLALSWSWNKLRTRVSARSASMLDVLRGGEQHGLV